MTKIITQEPWVFVELKAPTKQDILDYHKNKIKVSAQSQDSVTTCKQATVLHTFDEAIYPTGSVWIVSESPGRKLNYFGEEYTVVQKKDFYGRTD